MNLKKVMSAPVFPVSAPGSPNVDFRENASPAYAMYETLKDLCHNNADFFKNDDSDAGQRLHAGFHSLIENINTVLPLVEHVRKVAPSFDFDEKTPGNGYRSFVSVVDSCIHHGVKVNRQVCIARESLIFRKIYYTKEVEACCQLLASLETCLQHLQTMLSWSQDGELFPSVPHSPKELFTQSETINQYCFYGRCLGFQYHPSLHHILKGIAICMAGFSKAFYNGGNIINSVWAGGKYMIDPELRARRIVNISQFADIHFCKAFWFLAESEIMQKLPTFVSSSVAVNRLISIPPEPLELKLADGSVITIPVPDAHIGPQTLNVRLISKIKRQGMVGEGPGGEPRSRGLLVHCHGGGFVAQSSRSHEVYLRDWASALGVPLLSVDYSLAPQAPYPRAIQEVYYAYCWAIKNADMLGTTGERIVMVGDSAGGNLNMGACLKAAISGVPTPSGIMLIYTPLLVNFVPSPSRLLCLMDPLLPFGFMMRCLKAYACAPEEKNGKSLDSNKYKMNSADSMQSSTDKDFLKLSPVQDANGVLGVSDNSSFEEISESDLVELQAHKSPTSDHLSDTLSAASLSSEHRTLVTPTNEDRSQQYVSEFLEKYVLESDTDSEGHKIPVLRKKSIELDVKSSGSGQTLGDSTLVADDNVSTSIEATVKQPVKGIHTRISEAAGCIVGAVSNKFSTFTTSKTQSDSRDSIRSNLDELIDRSPSDEFDFIVPKDPFLSPYWADDELLKKVPPLKILSVHLDPCLDDCVMFAKKMRNLGNPVGLDILEGLPHGFLNFSQISSEAHNGSLVCIQRINELLDLESLDKPQDSRLPGKSEEPIETNGKSFA